MNKVTYSGDLTDGAGAANPGPSPSIWGDCPWAEAQLDPNVGFGFWDDFLNFSQHISDQSTQQYDSYIDTGVTIKQLPGVVGGQIEIAGNTTDNYEGVLSCHGPMFQVSDTAADAKKLWFEARVKKASITDEHLGMFIGLGFDHGSSVPIAVANFLTDNEADLGAFTYLGFHVDLSDGDAMDFVYKAEGQAQTVCLAGADTIVADTWAKFGFKYDPDAKASQRIKIYVDGVEQTTYVTATNIATATFPDAEPMCPVWGTKVGTNANEVKAQMDWWKAFQVR